MTKLKQIFADPLLCFLLLFFAVLPFVFYIDNVQSPFELPKYILSILTIALLFSWFCLRELRERQVTLKTSFPLGLLGLIFVAQTLSFVFSINPFVSFWGDFFLPADSWLSVLFYTLLAVLMNQLLDCVSKVRLLTWLLVLAAGLTALHGGLQKAGLEFFPQWIHHNFKDGVYGLLGQPVAYASLLGMTAPLALILFVQAKSRQRQLLLGSIILLINTCILFSGSRAPVFTCAFVSLLTLALLFFHRHYLQATKKIALALLLVIAAPAISQIKSGNDGLIQKLQSDDLSHSFGTRQLVWQNGIKAWLKNPILGTGPETFSITQLELQDSAMNFTPYWNNYWAKAHNYIVHTLTSTGLLGLMALLLLNLYMAFSFIGLFRQKTLTESQLLAGGFTAGFIFISIANLTAFNFVVTQIYGVVFPVVTGLLLRNFNMHSYIVQLRPRLKALTLVFLFLTMIPLCYRVISYWRSDMLYHQTISLNQQKKLSESMEKIEEAIRLSPSNPMFYCLKTDIILYLLLKNKPQLRTHAINETLEVMDETSKTCVELGINRSQFYNSRGMIFGNLYYDKVINSSSVAVAAFEKLKKITPVNPVPYYRTGLIYLAANREKDFLQEMEMALKLKPDYFPVFKNLLLHYYQKKDQAAVESLVTRVLNTPVYSPDMLDFLQELPAVALANQDLLNAEKLKTYFESQKKNYF